MHSTTHPRLAMCRRVKSGAICADASERFKPWTSEWIDAVVKASMREARARATGVSQPATPPNPQGLSRSEVDALIAERIEQFRTQLLRTGELRSAR